MDLNKGLFITFDGPNGVGKTTLLESVSDKLKLKKMDLVLTKEPTNTELGIFLKNYNEAYRGHPLACVAAADRYYHIKKIITPALDAKKIVLCDRYVDSSLVLQRIDNVDMDFIWAINRDVIIPDLSILFTASPQTLSNRLKLRNTLSVFEHDDNARMKEVEYYEHAAKFLREHGFNVFIINNEISSVDENSEIITGRIQNLIDRTRTD